MVYLILVNITLTVCYLLYRYFFKRLTFFQLNRCYLLGAIVISLVIPIGLFIDIPTNGFIKEQLPTVDLSMLMTESFVIGIDQNNAFSLGKLLQQVYWIGVVVASSWLLYRFFRVLVMVKRDRSDFSFAFFHRVVLGNRVRDNQAIAKHEQVHVEQGHSYDLLLLELVRVFNWFNPVLNRYVKEVKFQHECIADALCAMDKVAYAELLVAQAMQVESVHFVHEFSNQSILKNRIIMLFKDKSKRKDKLLYFAITPVLILASISTLIFNTSKAKDMVQDIEMQVANTRLDKVPDHFLDKPAGQEEQQASLSALLIAKPGTISAPSQDTTKVLKNTDVLPEPVGGFDNFRLWLAENYVYPAEAIAAQVKGEVLASFVVEVDGSLSNFRILKDLGHGTGKAAVDVLKKAEKWKPGIQDRKKVRVEFTLPIKLNTQHQDAKITLRSAATEGSSSGSTSPDAEGNRDMIFTSTDVNPEPEGGLTEFRKWLGVYYAYPQGAIDAGLKGQIVVSFVVEADGALSNFKVIKDLGYGTGEAVLDVLRKAPNWRPGLRNGQKVRVAYTLPVTLNLEQTPKS
ncbi:M56 family metallopeptidase [Sphingobacterium oryzagri]|uniref:M56 family metallopeptidase n=1 Tax=Sphingobacterium oryzagri TaxID=3025669 RepID=A0ABY7WGL7_9SPHI|nr:M56 family metallopeptidase [Sphingobacterium sp. KACC 22765]WDF68055.1 M56 family metallopeptidase [Sphingobacterium sp. KACC 22765]